MRTSQQVLLGAALLLSTFTVHAQVSSMGGSAASGTVRDRGHSWQERSRRGARADSAPARTPVGAPGSHECSNDLVLVERFASVRRMKTIIKAMDNGPPIKLPSCPVPTPGG
jgi:hypothetical protein